MVCLGVGEPGGSSGRAGLREARTASTLTTSYVVARTFADSAMVLPWAAHLGVGIDVDHCLRCRMAVLCEYVAFLCEYWSTSMRSGPVGCVGSPSGWFGMLGRRGGGVGGGGGAAGAGPICIDVDLC